jgi:O-antigen/teichoic acid export membrane protein
MTRIPDLKEKVLKGSIYLTLRQLLASGLSLVSMLVVARILGPKDYGIVTTALGLFYFFKWTGRLGLSTYLVRKPEIVPGEVQQILWFYNLVGIGFCGLVWLSAPVWGWWTGEAAVTEILRWLIPAIWLDMIGSIPAGLQERELRFDRVGFVDAIAQIVNYGVSVPIVILYHSYWGVAIGTLAQFGVFAALSFYFRPISWRWQWQWKLLKPALHYGSSFYLSDWIFTLKSLTVPLFVTRLAGVEAAGIVNIAIRLVQQLAMLRVVVRSMSISVMAKLVDDAGAIRRAINRGMTYQVLLMGGTCAIFSCCSSWLITLLFGERWLLSSHIFPLIGLAATVGSIFDFHSATLYATGENHAVSRLNFAIVGTLWLSAWVGISTLGLWGYGVAELAALPSYYLIHRSLTRRYGALNYRQPFWLLLASTPPILLGVWLPIGQSIALLLISYGVLFFLNADVRTIALELAALLSSKFNRKLN